MANLLNRFWQLSAPQDAINIEILSQKLDAAEKRINEYTHMISSLSAEIEGYQSIICHACKEKMALASLASSSLPSSTAFTQSAFHAVTPSNPDSTWNLTRDLQEAALPAPFITNARILAPGPTSPRSHTSPILTYNPQPTIFLPSITTSATSPDSPDVAPQLASAQSDWSVDYNSEVNRCLSLHVARMFALPESVFCTKFSRDGRYLAVGLEGGETHIYDILTGSKSILSDRSATVFYTDAHEAISDIWAACFSPDNKYIAIGSTRGEIKIWEISRRHVRAIFKHENRITSLDISPGGRFLVSGSEDGLACLWRIRDGSRRIWGLTGFSFSTVAFRPDGEYFAARIGDIYLQIRDVRTGQLVVNHEIEGDSSYYFSTVFTPDGKGIANGGHNLQYWDVGFLARGNRDTGRDTKKVFESNIGQGSFTDVSFSPDGRWLISGCRDNKVYILDAQTGSWLCTLKGHSQPVWGTAFSPVGHYIVSGSEDCRVILWKYEMVE